MLFDRVHDADSPQRGCIGSTIINLPHEACKASLEVRRAARRRTIPDEKLKEEEAFSEDQLTLLTMPPGRTNFEEELRLAGEKDEGMILGMVARKSFQTSLSIENIAQTASQVD